jgi:hypothetical protein
MVVASWNVNSIRAWLEHVRGLAYAAESGCFATTGAEGSRVSGAELFQELDMRARRLRRKATRRLVAVDVLGITLKSPLTSVGFSLSAQNLHLPLKSGPSMASLSENLSLRGGSPLAK